MSDETETNIQYLGQPNGAERKGMSDIVKVLRGKYALDYDEKTLDQFCNEAADEIEKLRAERRVMQSALLAIKAHAKDAHPMSYMSDLWRIASAALGEKE